MIRSKLVAAALIAGVAGGMALGFGHDNLTRGDVLPAVLGIGLSLPLGWTGAGLLRRR